MTPDHSHDFPDMYNITLIDGSKVFAVEQMQVRTAQAMMTPLDDHDAKMSDETHVSTGLVFCVRGWKQNDSHELVVGGPTDELYLVVSMETQRDLLDFYDFLGQNLRVCWEQMMTMLPTWGGDGH